MDDKSLAALLKRDAPSAHDLRFTLAVMARVERRQFHRNLLQQGVFCLAASLVLALATPTLNLVWGDIVAPLSINMPDNMMIAALLLAGAIAAMPWIAQRD